jgi:hypothetical protein
MTLTDAVAVAPVNIDFSAEPLFSIYVLLLIFSGIVMVALAAVSAAGQSVGWRIFNVLAGIAFFGYGVYLGFIFHGGTYLIFFKAFIVPVLLVVNFFRSMAQRKQAQQVAAAAPVRESVGAPTE